MNKCDEIGCSDVMCDTVLMKKFDEDESMFQSLLSAFIHDDPSYFAESFGSSIHSDGSACVIQVSTSNL